MKSLSPENGKPTIHQAATRVYLVREFPLVAPDRPSSAGVHGKSAVVLSGAVEHAVHNQRRGLELADIGDLEAPLHRQP